MTIKNVFRVTIHYRDGGQSSQDVIAKDDVAARKLAIQIDRKEFEITDKIPTVDFCAVELVTVASE